MLHELDKLLGDIQRMMSLIVSLREDEGSLQPCVNRFQPSLVCRSNKKVLTMVQASMVVRSFHEPVLDAGHAMSQLSLGMQRLWSTDVY